MTNHFGVVNIDNIHNVIGRKNKAMLMQMLWRLVKRGGESKLQKLKYIHVHFLKIVLKSVSYLKKSYLIENRFVSNALCPCCKLKVLKTQQNAQTAQGQPDIVAPSGLKSSV